MKSVLIEMESDYFSPNLDDLWDALLSSNPASIRAAYKTLSEEERTSIRLHLHRMTDEPGWFPQQRASAQAALDALKDFAG